MTRSALEIKADVAVWALGDDTGSSSRALARATCGLSEPAPFAPIDTGDFGRCRRLIRAVPEAREAVNRLAQTDHIWARLAEIWDEATTAYDEEQANGVIGRWGTRECPRTSALIKAATR